MAYRDHDVAKHREQVIQNELLTSEWQKACTTSERAQAEIVAVQKALECVIYLYLSTIHKISLSLL